LGALGAKAKTLLDEAGYKAGADGNRVGQCNGKEAKLSFRHSTTTPNQLRANVQAIVQQNLKDVGIEFTPDNKPSDLLLQRRGGQKSSASLRFQRCLA
jgi:ABC-type transport system substrate-binding protein